MKCHRNGRKPLNYAGTSHGWLFPIEIVGKTKRGYMLWKCLCKKCEQVCVLSSQILPTQVSCGCAAFKHGHHNSNTYCSWENMIQRTTNPKSINFKQYGGANPPVKLCKRWRESFSAFLKDMGMRPPKTTLGRFYDTGNYSKSNCSWMTKEQQIKEARKKRALQKGVYL